MAVTIQVKRGLEASLPSLSLGEFGFCTDSYKLFIGSAAGNKKVMTEADPLTSHPLVNSIHTASGLTIGHVVRATGTSTFAWAQLQHGDLGGVSANQHHNQAHVLSGADHTASGLTTGHVIRATGATTFAWAQLQHADLGGVSADQHHAQLHASSHAVGSADALSVGVPVDIGTANAEGSATNFARRDHVHKHPSGLGADLHHNQAHVLSGADHTASGLTAGQVVRATGATTFAWGFVDKLDDVALVGTNRRITFDTDDYLGYSGNTFTFAIASMPKLIIGADEIGLLKLAYLDRSGIATAGTQYPSFSLKQIASGWNTTTTTDVNLAIYQRTTAASGPTGNIPYSMRWYKNDNTTELMELNGLTGVLKIGGKTALHEDSLIDGGTF